ncbi:MAG: heme-binding protein [Deltaproteobacteria bacterium]|nr:heme-binding protein [Deltaproteobacteria bacterium]
MKWVAAVSAVVILGAVIGVALLGGGAVAYDSPAYSVIETVGDVEIREYEPYLVAETLVDGGHEGAGNQGFRILAKYIFGDNRVSQKIAMTAPVSQAKTEGTKIAMTAPVTQEKQGDRYRVQFMMPSEYSLDELPEPNDPRIALREIPARRFAAIRYSGTWSTRNYQKNLELLLGSLRDAGYAPSGEPIWARYDAPFKPWFLRRNEILTAFEAPVAQR